MGRLKSIMGLRQVLRHSRLTRSSENEPEMPLLSPQQHHYFLTHLLKHFDSELASSAVQGVILFAQEKICKFTVWC